MAAAPVILTSEELATREARNVVMVSSEEILPRKIPAYVSSKSEISFMFRQPSASAILINKPFIELELEFEVMQLADENVTTFNFSMGGASASGRLMEGLPFLTKCVRTSVISINGATQTYRNSEYLTSYLRTQMSREAMAKINVPFNEMSEGLKFQGGAAGASQYSAKPTLLGPSDSSQAFGFLRQHCAEGSATKAVAGGVKTTKLSKVTIREPLFMGVFGGLQGNDSFPLWSCEQNKSPSLLHVQQCTINFNMLDNWAQNLCGLYRNGGNEALRVTGVNVASAHLCCTYVQPPPKYIASALASNVTYASFKMLRFETTTHSQNNNHVLAPCNSPFTDANVAQTLDWTLEAVSFQYMPSTFLIEIAPDYNRKCNMVLPGNHANTAGKAFAIQEIQRRSKEDRRLGITQLDLIINTSPDVVPSSGTNGFSDSNIVHLRYNARQLYELYLKNCASVERAVYTFEQWFYGGCVVILSPQDMNGILPSQHIRGNISIQGTIQAVNTLGYTIYIGSGAPSKSNADGNNLNGGAGCTAWFDDYPLEKFRAQITGVYSNCYVALDAKSGLVGENILSEQFGNSLRLSAV